MPCARDEFNEPGSNNAATARHVIVRLFIALPRPMTSDVCQMVLLGSDHVSIPRGW